jgi:putative isomerase
MPELKMSAGDPRAQVWEDGFRDAYATLRSNLHQRPGKPDYAQPGPKYPAIYLWDSAFIADIWRVADPAVAQDVILSVLLNQRPDGRVPQEKSFFGTSKLSNPPLLSWEVMRIYRKTKNKEFLGRVYTSLRDFHAWYFAHRRLSNGIFFWQHPYESGLDNSPRFSDRPEFHFDDTTKIMAVDLSSYLVLDSENMAEMAEVLGRRSEAEAYRRDGAVLKELINNELWDARRHAYFDRRVDTGQFVHVLSIASLTPLVAGVPSQERADQIVKEILDPKLFNTHTPFPSVARSDPSFEKDCWRGPVWVNMAYLSILGMERYGYHDRAQQLSRKLVDGVYRTEANTGKFVEYYDPDRNDFSELTRKKGNLYKQITLGSKPVDHFVGWTGLVNNLATEELGIPTKTQR